MAIKNAEPEDYGKVTNHMLVSRLAGRAQLWPRGELIFPNKPSYFRPDTNIYRYTLKRDRRNGKEFEYLHSTGACLDQGLAAIDLFKSSTDLAQQGRLLHLLAT